MSINYKIIKSKAKKLGSQISDNAIQYLLDYYEKELENILKKASKIVKLDERKRILRKDIMKVI